MVFADKVMKVSKDKTNSVASVWSVPLGRIPGSLDPQSREALHEVDINRDVAPFSFWPECRRGIVGSLG
jgi:hypothetical protein